MWIHIFYQNHKTNRPDGQNSQAEGLVTRNKILSCFYGEGIKYDVKKQNGLLKMF